MSVEVLAFISSLVIVVIGWAVMFGVCKNKIENNSNEIREVKEDYKKDISELKADFKQAIDEVKADAKEQSIILQSINNNMTDLNSKFDLLINGHLNIKGVNN